MKISLELNLLGDAEYLNFWDSLHGHDVCCEIDPSGSLRLNPGQGDEQIVTLREFIEMVKKSAVSPLRM
jgi:hypothetical protein